MQSHLILSFACALLSVVNAYPSTLNVVEDAKRQESQLLRCWKSVEFGNPSAGYILSDPIHTLCSYMPDPHDYSKFYVNGVQESADDYTAVNSIFANVIDNYAILNICLQEGFIFSKNSPAQVSMRCMCKRDGCNIPKTITEFLDFNKNVIPAIHR